MCAKNLSPRPRPSCAPSINPGISAMTNSFELCDTTPSCGINISVLNLIITQTTKLTVVNILLRVY